MLDMIADFKELGLHGMASAWPEVQGTARIKSLDHETVLMQLIKAEKAQREVRSMAYQMRVARFPAHRDWWASTSRRPMLMRPWSRSSMG